MSAMPHRTPKSAAPVELDPLDLYSIRSQLSDEERLVQDTVRKFVDDQVIAQVIGTGATTDELEEAYAWVINNEAMMNMGRAMATGRVSQLVEILERVEEELLGTEEP